MKTIAISIDEPTLDALDRLARKGRPRRTRSKLVREAIAEFLARREEQEQEASEWATITKHRALLARQAKAMVTEQATAYGVTPRRRGIPIRLQ
jgi:metal-responsive CopG/Arc/MetJ family transcriptional regulator